MRMDELKKELSNKPWFWIAVTVSISAIGLIIGLVVAQEIAPSIVTPHCISTVGSCNAETP